MAMLVSWRKQVLIISASKVKYTKYLSWRGRGARTPEISLGPLPTRTCTIHVVQARDSACLPGP